RSGLGTRAPCAAPDSARRRCLPEPTPPRTSPGARRRTRWWAGSAQTVPERTARQRPSPDERAQARIVRARHVIRVERAGRWAVRALALGLRGHREPVTDGRVVAAVLEVQGARSEHRLLVRIAA